MMNYADIGLVLEIVGFLFAFGTFRIVFIAIAEIILMIKAITKRLMYYSSSSISLKESWENNKIRAKDLTDDYYDEILSKTPDSEERMPALANILKFIGWLLVTSGLILQFSYFNELNS